MFIFILLLFIFIHLSILFNPVLFKYKFYILTIIGLIIYVLICISDAKNGDLGFKKENALKSLKRNLPLIVLFTIIIIFIKILGFKRFDPDESVYFYLFYILISCPIQEFLYRGLFGYFDDCLIKNHVITLLISSFCYSFIHIIYTDIITCVLTFIMGIFWYNLYKKDNNLFGVTLSHCILGILTIFLGIIN